MWRRQECVRHGGVGIISILAAMGLIVPTLRAAVVSSEPLRAISPQDRAFLEDLEHRGFLYFWEQTDSSTGLVLDRSSADGGRAKGPSRDIASLAATGFGLTAISIGPEHGWITPGQARSRCPNTLQFFAGKVFQEHGWFYHWMDVATGESKWD